ncbi:MAG: DUF2927 domain-containing protein, partial [Rhodobacteraceae bacterium]|nr:DUF2927 domain-containing protein [Paracoccaceae bacterium]
MPSCPKLLHQCAHAIFLALILWSGTLSMPASAQEVSMNLMADPMVPVPKVPMLRFDAQPAPAPQRANADMMADLLDLQFHMESGRPLARLSRFEGPIAIALRGQVPATALSDMQALLRRLRSEARLDVRLAKPGQAAQVVVDFEPRITLRALVPTAACFVVPNVGSLAEYSALRSSPETDWANVVERHKVAIFIPSDNSPQEVRDCLHEEVAQSMGPINDLYRLTDSVFNDDNFNSVLTGFDMLVLRAHYAPELHSGMSEEQVAALLPGILARLNPRGEQIAAMGGRQMAPRAWVQAVNKAFGGQPSMAQRQAAADQMLDIARDLGWRDGRLGFSYYAVGRLYSHSAPERSQAAFQAAAKVYAALPGADIQIAHIDMQ